MVILEIMLGIYVLSVIVGIIYCLKDSEIVKELHEETNHYFTSQVIIGGIILSNMLSLIGIRKIAFDIKKYYEVQKAIKATYKLLEQFHKDGKINDEQWQNFLDIKEGKTKEEDGFK